MGKGDANYKCFVPAVRAKPEYPAANKHHLVRSLDELREALSSGGDYIAWDTETSSLSPEDGEIVGFSFAFSPGEGWYVPVNHIGWKHNLGHESLEIFYERLTKCKKTFVYNMRFDYRFMEVSAGFDMSKVPYLDVATLVHIADSNLKLPSLKWAETHFLGWAPDTFEETLGDSVSFQYLSPEEGYMYACADAEGTYALAGALSEFYREAQLSCQLDNGILYPLMKFEDAPLLIDVDALRQMASEETKEIANLEREIMNEFGYEFKLGSNRQLGEALISKGINTGRYTAKGQMKVDIKTLELFAKDFPILKKIIDYSKKMKAVNSYMNELADQAAERGGNLRFAYLTGAVPTGRLASGGDRKNPYFAKLNAQSVPKPHSKMWFVHDYVEGEEIPQGDIRVDKWVFSLTRKSEWLIEGMDPKSNIRACFKVPENFYWVSCDYSAQELRLTANYANEKLWIDTMLHGGDLHTAMAKAMWGEENFTKDLRKRAKIANFGLIYLMKPFSMPDKFGEPLEVCQEIYDKFWAAIPAIKDFQAKLIRRARKVGTVYNYLGRPRRVKYWFNTGVGKDIGFACRTVVNTVVQSMGGDILKISIMKLWKELYNNPKYKEAGVRFASTVHDEINSYVPANLLHEVVAVKKKCMTRKFPNWPLPIDIGLEIGPSFGLTFPFKFVNDERGFVPKMEHV